VIVEVRRHDVFFVASFVGGVCAVLHGLALIHLGYRRPALLVSLVRPKRRLDSVTVGFEGLVRTSKGWPVVPIRMQSSAAMPREVTHRFLRRPKAFEGAG
jgi:hypothetical protein